MLGEKNIADEELLKMQLPLNLLCSIRLSFSPPYYNRCKLFLNLNCCTG